MNKEIIGFDFFCGGGGVTSGLIRAGINVRYGVDFEPKFQGIYEQFNPHTSYLCLDIQDSEAIKNIIEPCLENSEAKYTLFAACAPCQPFSSQNQSYKKDERKSLLLNFVDFIKSLKSPHHPSIIFAENVGPMKIRGKEILEMILTDLECLGYKILEPKVINAAEYGVPQNRKRLIFVAVKAHLLKHSLEIFSWEYFKKKYSEESKTVKDVIYNLPKIEAGAIDSEDALHRARNLNTANKRKLSKITKPGGGREYWDTDDVLKCHTSYKGHKDVYGRMWWDRPSPTLTTKCISISNGRFAHPEQNRGISLREAAILQTMDGFTVPQGTSMEIAARVIGNAVPSLLVEKFGKFFLELLIEK